MDLSVASGEDEACSPLIQLPQALLQEILAHCGPAQCRTGVCLALVCRAFRDALRDPHHTRLWHTVAPQQCISEAAFSSMPVLTWLQLRRWMQARAVAITDLRIDVSRRPQLTWRDVRWELERLPHGIRLTSLVLNVAGARWPDMTQPSMLAPLARLGELRALRLALSFKQQSAAGWEFLRSMPKLTLLHLSNDVSLGRESQVFDFVVLSHLQQLEEAVVRIDHAGDMTPMASLLLLRRLTLPLPTRGGHAEVLAQRWESISGLTQLASLALLAPHDPGAFAEGFRTVPSDAALRCLTGLTQIQLQVAGVEPANGSVQPGVTRLQRLARLHVVGTLEGNIVELPADFGSLSALTLLSFSLVHFSPDAPLRGGLTSLQVLNVEGCSGRLCIACALPALQRLSLTEADDLELDASFVAGLEAQPATRCEIMQAWSNVDREGGVSMLAPVAAQLPRLHAVAILQPPAWRGLAASVSLAYLEDLDLQGCDLHSIPRQLGAASRMRRLRLGGDGAVLSVHAQDLETLSALRQLTFLSIAKPGAGKDVSSAAQLAHRTLPRWSAGCLTNLLYILWQLRGRQLTVVLREPCDVSVPLAVAAAAPPDALGRCALTTELVATLCQAAAATPWSEFGRVAGANLWAWLDARFPRHDAKFADIAELDGAAAMRVSVAQEDGF